MKKMILGVGLVLLLLAGSAWATPWYGAYSGTVDDSTTGVVANGTWASATLDYNVSWNGSVWTYYYDFDTNATQGAISNFILQLSSDIDADGLPFPAAFSISILDPSGDVEYGDWEENYDQNGVSDAPGLGLGFYGVKVDDFVGSDPYKASITILTSRAPMTGDFYSKDGLAGGLPNYFYADNAIPVPNDLDGVPIPGAVVILGFGLLGLVGARKKFVK